MKNQYFAPGEEVVLRRVWKGKIHRITAATVAQDTPDLIALYWGPGYPLKATTNNPLKGRLEISHDLIDGTWGGRSVLSLASPKAAHAVYAMWDEEHRLLEWYINLQEPLHRTAVGFDTTDYLLDIAVRPDRSKWVWQDEDEF
ncbi:DUF402 domain-containing protein [Alicyclobacillus fodiniaquatilis]|uniref:DUF402 domain-containing protein n=1 Tax=Alicyclobacillus fodiniaquatilis TaxID=1661150 RepID=A0ABW4JGM2_9BACL